MACHNCYCRFLFLNDMQNYCANACEVYVQSLQLERLAMYHDSDNLTWKMDMKWEDLSPKEWIEVWLICGIIISFTSIVP